MSELESRASIEKLITSETSHGQNTIRGKRKPATNVPLMIMIFIIICMGIVILYSVSSPIGYAENQDSLFYVKKQIRFTAIGLAFMIAFNYIDPVKFVFKKMGLLAIASGGLAMALAVATRLFGQQYNGARRWFIIAGFQFQPSEFVKVLLIIFFAAYRQWLLDARRNGKLVFKVDVEENKKPGFGNALLRFIRSTLINGMYDFGIPVGWAIIVDVFILIEPHTSCAAIIGIVVFICAISAGIHHRSWIGGGVILLTFALLLFAGYRIFTPEAQQTQDMKRVLGNFSHVVKRLDMFGIDTSSFVDEEDKKDVTKDDTRQIDNAFSALGSGGMWGVGAGESRSKFNYISEAQNDYIYSVYVEETGFVGGVILILIYVTALAMCGFVVLYTKNVYYRILAMGCTGLVFAEVLMNMAVELKLMPSTGVTLPLISYGGSAQIAILMAFGIILGCSRYGRIEELPTVEEIRRNG
ncbi:cell division protein FtsW [Ruminococcaceae bacterium YRB3002]|nr:cell division protein FtsW [Ruminococcaceae bacterium YRB3002]